MSEVQPSLRARARWITRHQLAHVNPWRKHTAGIHTRATGFVPFSVPARDSIGFASREARRVGSGHWDPGHLLLGLLGQDDGIAARALERLGISRAEVRQRIGQLTAEESQQASAPPHPHPAQHVIPAAVAEAAARCDDHIDTGHLLLALFRADDAAAAQVLAGLGAGESQLRGAITALRDESGPERSG
jgi:ATP-dependent Clp protease ATP-binding subunit ClpA